MPLKGYLRYKTIFYNKVACDVCVNNEFFLFEQKVMLHSRKI